MGFLSRPSFRWLVVVLVAAAGCWGALTLRWETELFPLLPQSLESVRALDAFQRDFSDQRELTVVTAPGVTDAQCGEWDEEISRALRAIPGIEWVGTPGAGMLGDPAELAAWILWNQGAAPVGRVRDALEPGAVEARLRELPGRLAGVVDPAELARWKLDPLGLLEAAGAGADAIDASLGTGAATPRAWTVRFQKAPLNFDECRAARDAVRSAVDGAVSKEYAGQLAVTGSAAYTAEIAGGMRRDMLVMVGVAVGLVAVAFAVFYGTVRPLGWVLAFQGLSILAVTAVARVVFGGLNVVSMGFASILLGVSLDYCILVYHHLASEERGNAEAWRVLRRGIWFSAATTAAAFFVLAASSFPGLRQLAVLVAVGLLATALWATWLMPAVLRGAVLRVPDWMPRASNGAASWLGRRAGWVIASSVLVIGAALALRPWANAARYVEGDLARFRPPAEDAARGQEWLQAMPGVAGGELFLIRAGSGAEARRVAGELASRAGAATGPVTALLPDEEAARGSAEAWPGGAGERVRKQFKRAGLSDAWARSTLSLVAELDRLRAGGGPPRGVASGWRRDGDAWTALVRLPASDAAPLRVDDLPRVRAVSWPAMREEVLKAATRDAGVLAWGMLGAVVVLCAVAQRSVRMVGLNVLALALAFSLFALLLRLTGTVMSPVALMSVPLLVGLVVDYSLHVLLALERERGLAATMRHIGPPIVLTGLASCIGFGAPMLASQPVLRNFGLVMDLGIVSAVAACLVALPAWHALGVARDYTGDAFYRTLYRPGGFQLAIAVAGLGGPRVAHGIGRAVGLLYSLLHRSRSEVVRRNLALLRPGGGSTSEVNRLYMHQGRNFAEYGVLANRPPEHVLSLVTERVGLEHLERARASGRGCLLVTGHLGFFELGGLMISQMGFPVTALTLPEPTNELTRWRADFRGRWGVGTIEVGPASFGVVDIVRELRAGKFIAMLMDRPWDVNTVDIELPCGRTRFAAGPAMIALLAGCSLIPVATVRRPDGGYRIVALGYLEPKWLPEGRDATLAHYTREAAAMLVPEIARHGDQWFQFVPAWVGGENEASGTGTSRETARNS